MQRQEDLSADVRLVAFAKFTFIIFATAHWIGCVAFYLASLTDFNTEPLKMNWVTAWGVQQWVDYQWYTASSLYTYIIILFKGFSVLTNIGYEVEVRFVTRKSRY